MPSRPLIFQTQSLGERVDLTPRLQELVESSGVAYGLCHLVVPHATGGLLVLPAQQNNTPVAALSLIVAGRRLFLPGNQAVYFVEDEGPRRRHLLLRVEEGEPPQQPARTDDDTDGEEQSLT